MLVEFYFFDEGFLLLLLPMLHCVGFTAFTYNFLFLFFFIIKSHNRFNSLLTKKNVKKRKNLISYLECNLHDHVHSQLEFILKNFICFFCYWKMKEREKIFLAHFSSTNFSHHHLTQAHQQCEREYFSHLSDFALNKRRQQWRVRLMGFMQTRKKEERGRKQRIHWRRRGK